MSLNKVMLIGNVGSEPSVRYLEGNTKVASFSLATSERYKDRNGIIRRIQSGIILSHGVIWPIL